MQKCKTIKEIKKSNGPIVWFLVSQLIATVHIVPDAVLIHAHPIAVLHGFALHFGNPIDGKTLDSFGHVQFGYHNISYLG